jgi:hypothetical protein
VALNLLIIQIASCRQKGHTSRRLVIVTVQMVFNALLYLHGSRIRNFGAWPVAKDATGVTVEHSLLQKKTLLICCVRQLVTRGRVDWIDAPGLIIIQQGKRVPQGR